MQSSLTSLTVLPLLIAGVLSQQCPDDWFDAGSLGCYKFLEAEVNLTWVEAQQACEKAGGYLAEPQSMLQIEFLSELASLEGGFTGIGYWYLGLTDLGREGDWLWVHHDTEVELDLWGPQSPSNKSHNTEDCGLMVLKNNAFTWEDHSCTAPQVSHHTVAPVCQSDTDDSVPTTTTTTTTLPTTTPFSCEAGWSLFNGSCYKLSDSTTTWSYAMINCVKEDAALTSVHSREEENFLNDLAEDKTYWLGGHPDGNTWVWMDYSDFDYTHDYNLSPGYGKCICQSYNTYGSGWSDTSCSSTSYQYYYICKKM